jgi:hypothetical protein
LIELRKRGVEDKARPEQARDKARKAQDKKRIQALNSDVKELEAKLRISQDTVDKMFGRKLEQSTAEELSSLEEALLTSYKLVVAQKAKLEQKEDEKKKLVPPPCWCTTRKERRH